MEPKPESLWWTSTHKCEDRTTLRVGSRGKTWDLPFREVFEVLGYRCRRDGKGFESAQGTMCKGTGSWWRDKFTDRSTQHSPERQHQLAVKFRHDRQSSSMGSEDIASHLQASHEAGRNMGGLQEKDCKFCDETVGGRWVCRC